jgi:hypothetical protein
MHLLQYALDFTFQVLQAILEIGRIVRCKVSVRLSRLAHDNRLV